MKISELIAVFILIIVSLWAGYQVGKQECQKRTPHIEGQNGRATK